MACNSILVVEDDEQIAWTLRELLESEGYTVSVASNGREALDLLPSMQSPCLVLLDLMMPVMNGWDFLKIKVKDMKIAPIPVVVVTAYQNGNVVHHGAERVMKKPIELETLLAVVRDYCQTPPPAHRNK